MVLLNDFPRTVFPAFTRGRQGAYDGENEKGGKGMEKKRMDLCISRALAPAYAGRSGELTAVLQYVFQAIVLGGCSREAEARALMNIAKDEMRHLEKLGSLLVSCGVPPVFTACPPYPVAYYSASNVDYTRKLPEMLAADIRAEREAIAGYTRILSAVRDERVRQAVGEIRAEEEGHLAQLEEMARAL